MILLLSGWGPVDGVVGFILMVRKEESLVRFPFGEEVRWAGLEEGISEWVRALVVCVWGCGGGGVVVIFSNGTVGDSFFQCLSFFFLLFFFKILILHKDVWKIYTYSLLKIWRF